MFSPICSALTSSPSWYTSNALDVLHWNHEDKCGVFYYVAKTYMYFVQIFENVALRENIKISKENDYSTQFLYYIKAHHDNIVGVSTINDGFIFENTNLKVSADIVSCGKDRMIRIWNFTPNSCTCLKEFNLGNTKLFTNPTCISVLIGKIIVCGFEKGYVLLWTYNSDKDYKTFLIENDDLTIVSCKSNLAAFGSRKGMIYIYSIDSSDVYSRIHKFKSHNSDVCGISWTPYEALIDDWGDLTSSGKDRKIKLWKLSKNLNIKTLTLPNTIKKVSGIDSSTNSSEYNQGSSNYSSVYWCLAFKGKLIVSTGFGLIGVWNDIDNLELKYFKSVNSKCHNRAVFGIKCFLNNPSILLSYSMDRIINISCINSNEKGEFIKTIPCVGGTVLSLAGSEHNNQLAIGCGDGLIRLWKFDNVNKDSNDVSVIWNGVSGKVLSLSWHPFREGLLAFGTEDGQVGYINLNKDKKVAVSSAKFHEGKVFTIQWALNLRLDCCQMKYNEKQDHLIVYSIGNYCLYGHNFYRDNDSFDFTDLFAVDSLRITDFSMHMLLEYFAVGYDNGLVRIFSVNKFQNVCKIKTHNKGINYLLWNPVKSKDYDFKLAIGSNERFVTVSDLTAFIKQWQNEEHESEGSSIELEFNDNLALFKGHGDRVTCIDWSPFDCDKLVTVSYDNVAFVWSISKNCALVSFNCHYGKLFCCKWSDRDEDLIYTGGDDCNLFSWQYSRQTLKSQFNRRRPTNNTGLKPVIDNSDKDTSIEKNDSVNVEKEQSKVSIITSDVKAESKKVIKKRTSLFPLTLFGTNFSAEKYQEGLLSFITEKKSCLDCFGLFSNRKEMIKIMEKDLSYHLQEKHYSNYFILLIWLNKMGKVIDECIRLDYTPDWLVALINSFCSTSNVVQENLLNLVVKNVMQNKNDAILAASYYVVAGNNEAAVKLLIQQGCIREALVLAKLRYSCSNPIITDLLNQLKGIYYKNGSFELSAAVCWCLNDINSFQDSLNRRNSALSVWCIIQAMFTCKDYHAAKRVTFNFVCGLLLDQYDCDVSYWIEKIGSNNEISVYALIQNVYNRLWIENSHIDYVVSQLLELKHLYSTETYCELCDFIEEKLDTKQDNRNIKQLTLYLTLEILVLIVKDNEDMNIDKRKNEFKEMIELLMGLDENYRALFQKQFAPQSTSSEMTGMFDGVIQILLKDNCT